MLPLLVLASAFYAGGAELGARPHVDTAGSPTSFEGGDEAVETDPREGPRVGVAPVQVGGDTAAHIDEKFQDEIDAALAEAGVEHLKLEEGWDGDCTDDACLAAVMIERELDFVIGVDVEVQERDFSSLFVVFDASGTSVGEETDACEICTPAEAAKQVGARAAEIGAELELPEPEPEPEGPEPEPPPPEPASKMDASTKARYIGYGLTGAGVVGLVSGIAMIALEEKNYGPKCNDANTDSSGECAYRRNTVEGGTVLTVLGGLAAGAGVTLLVLHRPGKLPSKLSLAPFGQFGRGVRVGGRF